MKIKKDELRKIITKVLHDNFVQHGITDEFKLEIANEILDELQNDGLKIDDLKCCGNCNHSFFITGEKMKCTILKYYQETKSWYSCSSWIYDNLTIVGRKKRLLNVLHEIENEN
jgi:hypothetical protein